MTELAAHKAESVAVSAEAAAATRLTTDRLAPQEGYVRLCSLSVPEVPYASRHCGSGTAANPAQSLRSALSRTAGSKSIFALLQEVQFID